MIGSQSFRQNFLYKSYIKMMTKKNKRENKHTKKGIKARNISFAGFNVSHYTISLLAVSHGAMK